MIQEDYVTFEQAKALKELKFPQESFVRYVIHEFNTSKDDITTHKNVGEIFHLNYVSDNPNNLQNYCTADRPTLSLVQKWLREEKGSYIEITRWDQNEDPEEHGFYWEILDSPNYKKILAHCTESLYEKPEQALSAGIDKCLDYEIQNKRENQNL